MNIWNYLKSLFVKIPPRPDGIVDAPLRDTDFVIGATSPIEYKERTDGNWSPFAWSQEKQWCIKNGKYQDNLGCTGNALVTSIETQIYYFTGKKIHISRRWINKMAGTNQGQYQGIGNTVIAPVDFVRKNGFVLEEDYPTPAEWTVQEYYADIPKDLNDSLLAKARKNKVKYGLAASEDDDCLKYEYLQISDPNIDKHLKHAPILASIPGHQTCAIFSPDQYTIYRDSYEPWNKTYASISFLRLLKVIIEPAFLESGFVKFQNHPEVWFMAKLDSMQTLEEIKNSFPSNYPRFQVREGIVTLPVKKPF